MTAASNLFIRGPVGRISVRTKQPEAMPGQAIVLVQGSNLTGQAMFDFSTPELTDYSLMDAIVARGFMAVTFAVRGYGMSELTVDPFSVNTDAAMEDLAAVIEWVINQGFPRPHLLGFSWGGRVAGRYAEENGDNISRLVLYDAARGGGNLVLPAPTECWWTNTREHYSEKLEPKFTDEVLRQAIGDYVTRYESRSPNGIRLENAHPVRAIDPSRVKNPTLMIYGVEAAKAFYMQGGLSRGDFFDQLATDDKSYVI